MTQPSFFGYLLSPKIIAETTWEVIEDFTQVGNGSILNIAVSPAIDFDKVSMLVLVFDGAFTVATNLVLTINGITSNYNTYGRRIKGGVETLLNFSNQGNLKIATDQLLTGNNDVGHSIIYITLNKAGTFKEVGFQIFSNGVTVNGNEVFSGALNLVAGVSSISLVSPQLTSGSWKDGTRITLYKVKR